MVDSSRKRVRIKLVNLNGLKQIKNLLKSLGIESNITGPNCDKTWYITVKDLKKFNEFIGFSEPKKRHKLENLVISSHIRHEAARTQRRLSSS